MDAYTDSLISQVVERTSNEIRHRKEYEFIQIGKWSQKGYKVSLEIFFHKERNKIHFDVRELKENQNHLQHIIENILDQIKVILAHYSI